MDTDSRTESPGLLGLFDLTADGFPFHPQRVSQIENRRTVLNDTLIFDILLSSGGIVDPASLYPPTDTNSLQKLLDAISDSRFDTLKKDSLVYFLLKWHQDAREDGFAKARAIPPHFRALSDAYWHLDSGTSVSRAVSLLSDRRLNRDYTSKIIHALGQVPPSEGPASRLIVKYVTSAKPSLVEPVDIDSYILALAEEQGFRRAWEYQRTYSEANEHRERLWRKLVEWTASPKPHPQALSTLLTLPLSPFEHSILLSLASATGSSQSETIAALAVYQDVICVRFIQTGKYADAIKYDRQFAASTPENVKNDQMRERERMCKEVYNALPDSERLLLDNGPRVLPPKQAAPASGSANNSLSQSLSQSWVEVPLSMSQSSPSKKPLSPKKSIGPLSTPVKAPLNASQSGSSLATSLMASRPKPAQGPGAPLPFSPLTPLADSTASPFKSANKQANAFYKPPSSLPASTSAPQRSGLYSQANGSKEGLGQSTGSLPAVNGNGDPERSPSPPEAQQATEDVPMDLGDEDEPSSSLQYSIFSGAPPPRPRQSQISANGRTARSGRGPSTSAVKPQSEALRANGSVDLSASVPGAFNMDENDEEYAVPAATTTGPPTKRKSTAARKSSTSRSSKRQKIPGGLDDHEEDDDDHFGGDHEAEEAEEADEVAPLPSKQRVSARRARASSSTPAAAGDEGDAPARRRSTRLSGTGTVPPLTQEPDSLAPTKAPAKKRGRKKKT